MSKIKINRFKQYSGFASKVRSNLPKPILWLGIIIYYLHFVLDIFWINKIMLFIKNKKHIKKIPIECNIAMFEYIGFHPYLLYIFEKVENIFIEYFKKNNYEKRYYSHFINLLNMYDLSQIDLLHFVSIENFELAEPKAMKKFKQLKAKKTGICHNFKDFEVYADIFQYFDKVIISNEYIYNKFLEKGIKNLHFIDFYPSTYSVKVDNKEELRKRFNIPQEKIVFSFLGSIRPDKSLGEFIESIVNLPDESRKDVFINIHGHINSKDDYQLTKKLESSDISNRIDIRASRGTDLDFVENIIISDYVVLPYLRPTENTSGILLESVWWGVPIIGPSSGPIGFEINKWNLGYTFDIQMENDLTGTIANAILHPHQKESKWNEYRGNINPEKVRREYLDLFEMLVNEQ